jgi:hypothetical protein
MTTLAKLLWVEVKLFAREPIAVVFAFAFPLVVLLVLAGVLAANRAPTSVASPGSTTTFPDIWPWSSPPSA